MKFVYATLSVIIISIILIFTFKEDLIYYNYAKITIKNDNNVLKNIYYYEDEFSYIDDYEMIEINNKKQLYETIYFLVNSGVSSSKRYFNINYLDFEQDYNELFSMNNKIKLNSINNFVHPYNTFSSISASLKGYALEVIIDYKYSDEKRKMIDEEVDKIINEIVEDTMTTREKIKVIHDYIVNNTDYDKDFCIKENKEECLVNSPYQSDTAYGVLFEHKGICSGYTDLMAIFLDKLNVTNYRITNDYHTWNAVKIDNIWYHLDATWDDPISSKNILSHTYFLITTTEDSLLEEPHYFDKEIFVELS